MQWIERIDVPRGSEWMEVFILAILLYYIFRFIQGTRGSSILSGLVILFGTLYVITSLVKLDVLNWILSKLTLYFPLAVTIIFQSEIRRALARLGRQPWRKGGMSSQKNLVEPIMQAVQTLSSQKIGALIAIEREIGTRAIQDTGTRINGRVSAELLAGFFFPRTPLHDGGVIISGKSIRAAGCLFPLSQREQFNTMFGTRHRAAIGITEETDAVVVVVSEETGHISLAYNGRLRSGLSKERLQRMLSSMLGRERTGLSRFREKIETGQADLADPVLINFDKAKNDG